MLTAVGNHRQGCRTGCFEQANEGKRRRIRTIARPSGPVMRAFAFGVSICAHYRHRPHQTLLTGVKRAIPGHRPWGEDITESDRFLSAKRRLFNLPDGDFDLREESI